MPKSRGIRIVLIVLAVILAIGASGYLARDALFFAFFYRGTRADWELGQLRGQMRPGQENASGDMVREQCLAIAGENPGTRTEVAACLFVASEWPDSEEAIVAHDKLLQAAEHLDIAGWERSLNEVRSGSRGAAALLRWRPLAALLIDRARRDPAHPMAARLLCEAAVLIHPDSNVESAPPELAQIAGMIRENYAASPGLANFCEVAGSPMSPVRWSLPFENDIRYILDVNEDRFVRCTAQVALASIAQAGGAARQEEALDRYEEFLTQFDGNTAYPAQSVEQLYRQQAKWRIEAIRTVGIGSPAPETRGEDLGGNPIALEDYRGRIVLVTFWASWCGPCLRAVPHERALLETFGESGFAILGINADDDLEKARAAVEKHGIAWPSLRESTHPKNWKVHGYPTLYLLDGDGAIARYWTGTPPDAELEDAIRRLIRGREAL